ncbi:hypothetical protein AGMMS50276_01140 [Synergistales bacterium]|nr:hypothetical protein AGMMS50276_01140 [Synergistales bacterium]
MLNAGARAGKKNDPKLFSVPIAKAAREMKNKKGNIQRVRRVAKAESSASKPGAIITVKTGAKIIPKTVTQRDANISTLMACPAKDIARVLESAREKTGTKAAESAPSASS